MLRIEVSEAGQGALPPIDVDDAVVVIGSGAAARVRLPELGAGGKGRSSAPKSHVAAEHVRIEAGRWRAVAPVTVEGAPRDSGDIGDGVTLELGGYHIRIAPAPAGAAVSSVQRTESLARELMRNLLGTAGAPSLEIERGAHAGAKRPLGPPEFSLYIGRGDEAGWIIADKDLSRLHAEIRRGWDGTRITDLDSKNGTKVDGDRVGPQGMALRDGCVIELGPIVMRFRDPAEKHLQGDAPAFRALAAAERRTSRSMPAVTAPPPMGGAERRTSRQMAAVTAPPPVAPAADVTPPMVVPPPSAAAAPPRPGNPAVFYGAVAIMVAALAALIWILAS